MSVGKSRWKLSQWNAHALGNDRTFTGYNWYSFVQTLSNQYKPIFMRWTLDIVLVGYTFSHVNQSLHDHILIILINQQFLCEYFQVQQMKYFRVIYRICWYHKISLQRKCTNHWVASCPRNIVTKKWVQFPYNSTSAPFSLLFKII